MSLRSLADKAIDEHELFAGNMVSYLIKFFRESVFPHSAMSDVTDAKIVCTQLSLCVIPL
jgi:hypothetical protein